MIVRWRALYVLTLFLLVLLGGLLELRARECGIGPLPTELPLDLRGIWWMGGFSIEDAHGWGVIAAQGPLRLKDGSTVQVAGIERYATTSELAVLVRTESGDSLTLAVRANGGQRWIERIDDRVNGNREAMPQASDWIGVSPDRCFGGSNGVWLLRVLLWLCLGWMILNPWLSQLRSIGRRRV